MQAEHNSPSFALPVLVLQSWLPRNIIPLGAFCKRNSRGFFLPTLTKASLKSVLVTSTIEQFHWRVEWLKLMLFSILRDCYNDHWICSLLFALPLRCAWRWRVGWIFFIALSEPGWKEGRENLIAFMLCPFVRIAARRRPGRHKEWENRYLVFMLEENRKPKNFLPSSSRRQFAVDFKSSSFDDSAIEYFCLLRWSNHHGRSFRFAFLRE